jgi:hypothetical protein
MGSHQSFSNRRGVTLAAGVLTAGALLLAGPAATAFADTASGGSDNVANADTPAATPDYSIGGFLNNAGQFVGHLGTNTEQFVGTLGTNAGQFVGTLGTNTLVFAGTLANNLVGNPSNAGGKPVTTSVTPNTAMNVSFQCNATGKGSCAVK